MNRACEQTGRIANEWRLLHHGLYDSNKAKRLATAISDCADLVLDFPAKGVPACLLLH
jgi:hypothetical protein